MLDAVIRKKLRGDIKDLIYEKSELHRLRQEDVITSTVFGPLKFMQPADAWLGLVLILLPDQLESLGFFVPKASTIEFWPRLDLHGQPVEPDLICVFENEQQRHVFVIEVKWNAKLHDAQLPTQGKAVMSRYDDEKTTRYHFLISKTITSQDAQDQIAATPRCKGISWHLIAAGSRGCLSKAANLWVREIQAMLGQLGIRIFDRFDLGKV